MGHGCVDACNLNVSAHLNVSEIPKVRSVYLWYGRSLRSSLEARRSNNGPITVIQGNNVYGRGNNSGPLPTGPSISQFRRLSQVALGEASYSSVFSSTAKKVAMTVVPS